MEVNVETGVTLESTPERKCRCDCCGKLMDHTNALCSGIAAMSFNYCNDCARKDLEPYSVLVPYFAGTLWRDLTAYWQNIIRESCEVNGHTLEQFHKDCDDYMESCRRWSDKLIKD